MWWVLKSKIKKRIVSAMSQCSCISFYGAFTGSALKAVRCYFIIYLRVESSYLLVYLVLSYCIHLEDFLLAQQLASVPTALILSRPTTATPPLARGGVLQRMLYLLSLAQR